MPPKPTVPMSRASHTWSRRQRAQLAAHRGGAVGRLRRHPAPERHDRDDARSAPTTAKGHCQPRCWPSSVVERHADDVGDGQAGEHHRDRPGAPVPRHQRGGDHRADAEERAVRQARHEARDHQHRVAPASAEAMLPTANATISHSSTVRRADPRREDGDQRAPRRPHRARRPRRRGRPWGWRSRPRRRSRGSSPIVTNSVVPMANPPIASARMARLTWRAPWRVSSASGRGGGEERVGHCHHGCSAHPSSYDRHHRTPTARVVGVRKRARGASGRGGGAVRGCRVRAPRQAPPV